MAAAKEHCLDEIGVTAFLEGRLPVLERKQAESHVASCPECRKQLTGLARGTEAESQSYRSMVLDESGKSKIAIAADPEQELSPGTTLGRYVLLGKVGAGGMGVVYSALDPELDRRIAVKVIRSAGIEKTHKAQERLRQEAKAMARLTHPNVVRVYDVGTQGDLVYIAMEFVDGEDLYHFARRHREQGQWRPILSACAQAGEGLSAAHRAGLVHRDFKSSNVLCAKDGRVLVADFGLTRFLPGATGGDSKTMTTALGTRGFASPEQVAGKLTDAKSDQYSFCATLAECLLGLEPGPTLRARVEDRGQGAIGPKGLAAVMRKGLEREPADRHEDMEALLARLDRKANRRRRVAIVAAIAMGVISLASLMFIVGVRASAQPDPCAQTTRRFADLWSQSRRAALESQLASSPYKRQAPHFLEGVDAVASSLQRAHSEACRKTFSEASQSTALFDRQMFCLNASAADLSVLLAAVEKGTSVETVHSGLADVDIEECQVSDAMLAAPPPPSEAAERIQEVQDLLSERSMASRAGDHKGALELVQRARSQAREIGYEPLVARSEIGEAIVLSDLERYEEAKAAAKEARDSAAKGRDTTLMIRSLLLLAEITSEHLDAVGEADAYLDTARSLGMATKLHANDEAHLMRALATLARLKGESAEAIEFAETGLEFLSKTSEGGGRVDVEIALLGIISAAHFDANELEQAALVIEAIYSLKKRRLGPEHSDLAVTLTNLATVQLKLNRLDEALESIARARALMESPDSVRSQLARCVNLEGLIQARLGNFTEAVEVYRTAIELQREIYGEDHRMTWSTRNNLGNALGALQRWGEANAIYEEYAEWAVKKSGLESDRALNARINLANNLVRGHLSEEDVLRSEKLIREVLALLPAEEPRRVNALSVLGDANFQLERFEAATKNYQDALRLGSKLPHTRSSLKGHIASRIAEAQWQWGKKQQAIASGKQALAFYDEAPSNSAARDELAAWIEARQAEL